MELLNHGTILGKPLDPTLVVLGGRLLQYFTLSFCALLGAAWAFRFGRRRKRIEAVFIAAVLFLVAAPHVLILACLLVVDLWVPVLDHGAFGVPGQILTWSTMGLLATAVLKSVLRAAAPRVTVLAQNMPAADDNEQPTWTGNMEKAADAILEFMRNFQNRATAALHTIRNQSKERN